jgi:predicted GNAT family acetyltransferase
MDTPCNNKSYHRYELQVGDHLACADYGIQGDLITFTHTIVPKALEGQGIGSRLIAFALADSRAAGLKVVPQCSFVRAYIDRHPEWQDLLV